MASQPTPQEATEALRNADRRTEQARGSLRGAPRRLDWLFGTVIFLYCTSYDFAPSSTVWSSWAFGALVLGYVIMVRTRRGAALLGHSVRIHRQAVSSKFVLIARLTIAVAVAASMVSVVLLGSTHTSPPVPYLSTIVGAVLAIALIGFGPQLRAGLAALAGKGHSSGGLRDGQN
jgi:predicted membrane channel-forming protein YqfA (hemolysin III family)